MDIIPEPLKFEWDKGNIDKNVKKHGITNENAEKIFLEEKSIFSEDIKHSKIEKRYQILGESRKGQVLSVVFTIRNEKVRIISARQANQKERKLYETKNKKTK